MIEIVTDSSTLYTPDEAQKKGFEVVPLQVVIDGKTSADLTGITATKLVEMIKRGGIPSTSQPPVGLVEETFNTLIDEGKEVLDLTMADGLSGAYQSACLARNMCNDPEKVTVINTKTLCGPHRELVKKARKLVEEGKDMKEITDSLQKSIDTDISYLIPFDFSFLKRGGRVSPMAAGIGGLLKLIPVMKKSEDGKQLDKLAVSRTFKSAMDEIVKDLKKGGADNSYTFYITHAQNEDKAMKAQEYIKKAFPEAKIILYPLSPAFIAQGGPGCIAIQAIKM